MDRTLTLFDCTGIQAYLFQSSRLQENLGASTLVDQALEDFLPAAVARCATTLPAGWWDAWRAAPGVLALTGDGATPEAEPLFVGGGNAALLFRSRDLAERVVTAWSERLLGQAPGLRGVAVHADCPAGGLGMALRRAQEDLTTLKRARRPAGSPLRLPVSRACESTGLAANEAFLGPEGIEYLARVAVRKRREGSASAEQMGARFPFVEQAGFRFTDQLDELGGRVGQAHIAVVHVDGNRVGRRLEAITRTSGLDDAAVAARLRSVSMAARAAVVGAMEDTLRRLLAAMPELERSGLTPARASDEQGIRFLPLRPIVLGGDDVTFVCDGRIGIPLAAAYLESFSGRPDGTDEADGRQGVLSACAGVAIVPARFPFRRAYDLAEALTDNAKHRAREWSQEDRGESSWLDWELELAGALTTPAQRREEAAARRGYRPAARRPWRVWPPGDDEENWRGFETIIDRFANRVPGQEEWPRSRVKALRDALATNAQAVADLKRQFESRGLGSRFPTTPAVPDPLANPGQLCLYYDAVEALDFYLPLLASAGGR